jgi:hypothetical protein
MAPNVKEEGLSSPLHQIDNQRRTPLPEGRYEAPRRGVGPKNQARHSVKVAATTKPSLVERIRAPISEAPTACEPSHVDSCVCPSFGDGDRHYSWSRTTGQHLVVRRSRWSGLLAVYAPLLLFTIVLRSNSYFLT